MQLATVRRKNLQLFASSAIALEKGVRLPSRAVQPNWRVHQQTASQVLRKRLQNADPRADLTSIVLERDTAA